MTEAQPTAKSSRRRRFLLGAMIILLIGIGAAWTYGWMLARDMVAQKFDAFLAREVQAGRIHECGSRRIGGYPFLIEITCDAPVIRFADGKGQMSVSFSSLKTVALIYAPNHIITEFGSPLVVSQNDQTVFSASFRDAQTSFRHKDNSFERFSLIADDLQIEFPQKIFAKHAEFHIRPSLSSATGQDYDLAVEAEKLVLPNASSEQSVDVSLASAVRGWPSWRVSAHTTLNEWQQSEGHVDIQDLRIKRNDGLFVTKGDLHFNDARRAEGRFDATFVNSSNLLRGLVMQGQNDAGALFGPLFMMLGKKVEFEGKRATQMQLKVDNGVISLGSLVLGELPPLY
ncbi:MAG: DUF2125 domain-containing protein [Pseudomonadota bacterium]